MKNIPYGRHEITDEDIEQVTRVLRSDFLTQGPTIAEFENQLAQFLGAKHVVAVSNGTTALHLCAKALGVQRGDWILTTPNTFVASANCIRYCDGDVEFVDINRQNYCLDLDLLEKKLASGTKKYTGIVAVDFAGYPLDFERLRKIADKYSLWIMEDTCHAIGAEFKTSQGEWVKSGNGKFADLSVFSFHPVKHVATGEGGAIATNNDRLAEHLRRLRTHGITRAPHEIAHPEQGWYHEMQELGFNFRLPDLNAVLGISQLHRLEQSLSRRRQFAEYYDERFDKIGICHQQTSENIRHAYHLYVIESPKRLELYNFLRTKGILAQVHYIPVCDQPYYKSLYGSVSVPQMQDYYSKALSIPMYPSLSSNDVEFVADAIEEFHS